MSPLSARFAHSSLYSRFHDLDHRPCLSKVGKSVLDRVTRFGQKIIAMYAFGMPVREVQGYLVEVYDSDGSTGFVSKITDDVMFKSPPGRFGRSSRTTGGGVFDALRLNIRDDAVVHKAMYVAQAVVPDGPRDVLGIWIEQTEGSKLWLTVSSTTSSSPSSTG